MSRLMTIVDTDGEFVAQYPITEGNPLVIVSSYDHSVVVMEIDEVSDDDTINVFLKTDGSLVTSTQVEENVEDPMTHEILIERV